MWRGVERWEREGEVEVGRRDAFWEGVMGREMLQGNYVKGERTYAEMVEAVKELADGLCVFFLFSFLTTTLTDDLAERRLEVVRSVTLADGRMDEQWDVETGEGTGARELTWCVVVFSALFFLLPLEQRESKADPRWRSR